MRTTIHVSQFVYCAASVIRTDGVSLGYCDAVTSPDDRRWTFLSNHGHVLVALSRTPDARVRDLADEVGISERAALSILGDLETAGYISKQKVGRRNTYRLHPDMRLRHPAESTVRIAPSGTWWVRPIRRASAGRCCPANQDGGVSSSSSSHEYSSCSMDARYSLGRHRVLPYHGRAETPTRKAPRPGIHD